MKKRDPVEVPPIGTHLAVLNLFREPDGTCQITVADAGGGMIEFNGLCSHLQSLYERPIDYIETLIVAAADNIRERKGSVTVKREPTHYVLPRGTNSMVKVADFFLSQKGSDLTPGGWWTAWKPVYVEIGDDPGKGVEAARELAAHMTPIERTWKTLEPHLPDDVAMNPDDPLYRECRGKWRSPIA
jgi:hypothetical protein